MQDRGAREPTLRAQEKTREVAPVRLRLSVGVRTHGATGQGADGRREVDVGDRLPNHSPGRAETTGPGGEERDVRGVRSVLAQIGVIHQSVRAPVHAVVTGKDDERVVESACLDEGLSDGRDHVIDGEERPADGSQVESRIADAWLAAHVGWLIRHVGFVVVRRVPPCQTGTPVLVPGRWRERVVGRVRRQPCEQRSIGRRLADERSRFVREQRGRVLLGIGAVLGQRAVLTTDGVPVVADLHERAKRIPAGWDCRPHGLVVVDVLPDQHRVVPDGVEFRRDRRTRVEPASVVVDDAMSMRVLAREIARTRRATEGCLDECVREPDAVVDEGVPDGRQMRPHATVDLWQVIEQDDHDVGGARRGPCDRRRRAGEHATDGEDERKRGPAGTSSHGKTPSEGPDRPDRRTARP
jgi:hypothetical protein